MKIIYLASSIENHQIYLNAPLKELDVQGESRKVRGGTEKQVNHNLRYELSRALLETICDHALIYNARDQKYKIQSFTFVDSYTIINSDNFRFPEKRPDIIMIQEEFFGKDSDLNLVAKEIKELYDGKPQASENKIGSLESVCYDSIGYKSGGGEKMGFWLARVVLNEEEIENAKKYDAFTPEQLLSFLNIPHKVINI